MSIQTTDTTVEQVKAENPNAVVNFTSQIGIAYAANLGDHALVGCIEVWANQDDADSDRLQNRIAIYWVTHGTN